MASSVVDYCDGLDPGFAVRDMPAAIKDLQAKAKGRDPQSIEVSFFWRRPGRTARCQYQGIAASRRALGAAVGATGDES